MSEEVNNTIDCLFFESIIKGDNRPFLPKFDSEEELLKLYTITVPYTFTDKCIGKWWHFFNVKNVKTADYGICKTDVLELFVDSENATINLKILKPGKSSTYLFKKIDVISIKNCWQLFNIPFEEFDTFNYNHGDKVLFRFELEKKLMVFSIERGDFPYLTENDNRYDEFLKSKKLTPKQIAFYKYFERHYEYIYRKGTDIMVFCDHDELLKQYTIRNLSFLLSLRNDAVEFARKFNSILLKDGEIQHYEYPYGNKKHLEIAYEIIVVTIDYLIDAINFYNSTLERLAGNYAEPSKNQVFGEFMNEVLAGIINNDIKYQIKTFEYSNINDVFEYINDSLHELKMHIIGTSKIYTYYYLEEAFDALLVEFVKRENYSESNAQLLLECSKKLTEILFLYLGVKDELKKNINDGNKPFFAMMDLMIQHKCNIDDFLHKIVDDFDVVYNYYFELSQFDVDIQTFDKEIPNDSEQINKTDSSLISASTENIKQKKGNVIPNSFSYKNFAKNPEGIICAFEDLINDYISCDPKDFKRIFDGQIPERKIIWKKTLTELSYFIKLLLFKFEVIDELKQKHWEVTAKCFLDSKYQEIVPKKLHGLKKPADKAANFLEKVAKRLV